MSLLTSSIDLETIALPKSGNASQFPAHQIENLANLFLQAGDTISPILLRKISPISFEILEGHFEYHAAIKAQEIDDQFTAIRAYVVPPELESTILQQYNFLRSTSTIPMEQPAQVPNQTPPDLAQIEEAIALRLEQKLTAAIERKIEEQMSSSVKTIVSQVTKQLDAHLTDFRQSLSLVPVAKILEPIAKSDLEPEKISKTNIAVKPKTTTKTKESKAANKNKVSDNNDPKILQVLNDLNTFNVADLEKQLAKSAKGNVKFGRLIHVQREKQLFTSIEDVIARVDKLGEATVKKIIAAW